MIIDHLISIVGHRYDGQSSVPRHATIINHQRTCVHSRVLGVLAAELRGDTTDMAPDKGDKGREPQLDSGDAR